MSAAGKIRIMFVIGSLGDVRAGTEKNLLTIIENLDRQRFEPYLVSLQDCEYIRAGNYVCPTECLHLYRVFSPRMLKLRRALAARMVELGIDIVQTFFVEADLVGGGAARQAGIRHVIASRRNLGYAYGIKQRIMLKFANRYPRRWLANCEAVADSIARIEHLGRERFDVIYNGVPLNDSERSPQDEQCDAIMVANLRPIKRVETLLEAATILRTKLTDFKIAIVGDGPLRDKLKQRADSLGLADCVKFLGSRTDIPTLLKSAKIGVLTSQSEGCSNAILEYMSTGLPVVATAVGGNLELVEDGSSGYLVAVADSEKLAQRLKELISNGELRQRMGERGRQLIEQRYSLERMVAAHEDYYLSCFRDSS